MEPKQEVHQNWKCVQDTFNSLNLGAQSNVLGSSSQWNTLRPYAIRDKSVCNKKKWISNAPFPLASLHHSRIICELCNESDKHKLRLPSSRRPYILFIIYPNLLWEKRLLCSERNYMCVYCARTKFPMFAQNTMLLVFSKMCRMNIHKQRGHQMNKHFYFFLLLLLSFFKMNSRLP